MAVRSLEEVKATMKLMERLPDVVVMAVSGDRSDTRLVDACVFFTAGKLCKLAAEMGPNETTEELLRRLRDGM